MNPLPLLLVGELIEPSGSGTIYRVTARDGRWAQLKAFGPSNDTFWVDAEDAIRFRRFVYFVVPDRLVED